MPVLSSPRSREEVTVLPILNFHLDFFKVRSSMIFDFLTEKVYWGYLLICVVLYLMTEVHPSCFKGHQ